MTTRSVYSLDARILLQSRVLAHSCRTYVLLGQDTHQGIEQYIPCQPRLPLSPPSNGILASSPVLNGLHHTYSWVAGQSVEHSQAQRPVYH